MRLDRFGGVAGLAFGPKEELLARDIIEAPSQIPALVGGSSLEGKSNHSPRLQSPEFAFSGLIKCSDFVLICT